MFEISTEGEEKAYRLGYCEGRADGIVQALAMGSRVACSPTVCSMSKIYHRMRDYQIDVLQHWRNEESPEIGEPPLEFDIS